MIQRLAVLLMFVSAIGSYAQTSFHGNNAHTGVFDGPGPKQLGVKWTFKAAGPILTSATVADGVVYIGSMSGHLYAIDQQTGKEKWNFKSRMPIASSGAIADGTLYFVSTAGPLVALDISTGKPKWIFGAEFEKKFEAKGLHGMPSAAQTIPDAYDVYISSPAVANGKVYFGSGDGNVYAVDTQSGLLQWKFPTKDVVHASPAVVNNTVYIGSWDSSLYAIDAESGQLKWSFEAGQDPVMHNQVGFQSSPAIADGMVYVGCRDGHVYALDANNGRKKWDYPTAKSWVNSTPAVRDGMVYAATSDKLSRLPSMRRPVVSVSISMPKDMSFPRWLWQATWPTSAITTGRCTHSTRRRASSPGSFRQMHPRKIL